jgi:hypothetical protein
MKNGALALYKRFFFFAARWIDLVVCEVYFVNEATEIKKREILKVLNK